MDEIKKPEHLTKYIEKTKYQMFVPLVILNYPFRWLAYALDKVALLKVLEFISVLSIVVGVYFYITEAKERQKAKHYQAWQVINSAQGKTGNGGRTDALQDLNNDGISLAGVDLSMANLENIQLKGADLYWANLSKTGLVDANLSRAMLLWANLSQANLSWANLSWANLSKANLSGAYLLGANLSLTNLSDVNLSGANLSFANLSWANLSRANLSDANFSHAILAEVNLSDVKNWREIESMERTRICKNKNCPEGFIKWAEEQGAVNLDKKIIKK